MRYRTVALAGLVAVPPFAGADDVSQATTVVCTPQPVICTTIAATSHDRFAPLVQHLLVRSQLESQPKGWQMVFLYVPNMDTRALEELQIRFLDELLARQKAQAARVGTNEGGVEDPHTWTQPGEATKPADPKKPGEATQPGEATKPSEGARSDAGVKRND